MGTSAPPTTLDISLYFWVSAWAGVDWSAHTAPGGLSAAAVAARHAAELAQLGLGWLYVSGYNYIYRDRWVLGG